MLYLKSIEITNFRTHEHTVVEFSPGTNGLIGLSGSGKTNVFRAYKWNTQNEPSGTDFIMSGKSEACVITNWSDGTSIKRVRNTKTKNMYAFYKDGVLIEEYTGFGSKVPQEIAEFLNLNEQGDFIFANQLEGPFLLSITPRARAEKIGNLEELEKVDTAIADVNSDIKASKREEKNHKQQIADKSIEISKLELEIRQNEEKVKFLNQLKESIETKENIVHILSTNRQKIVNYIDEIERIQREWSSAKRVLAQWDDTLVERFEGAKNLERYATRLTTIQNELSSIHFLDSQKVEELTRLTEHITEMKATYHTLERYVEELKRNQLQTQQTNASFNKKVASISLDSIDTKIDMYTSIFKYAKRLQEIHKEQNETQQDIQQAQTQIEVLLNEFVTALHEEKICPTCYQATEHIDKETIEQNI